MRGDLPRLQCEDTCISVWQKSVAAPCQILLLLYQIKQKQCGHLRQRIVKVLKSLNDTQDEIAQVSIAASKSPV
jgi:hypothetical protein